MSNNPVSCPYISSHKIVQSRLLWHLTKCNAPQTVKDKFSHCKHNYLHIILKESLLMHEDTECCSRPQEEAKEIDLGQEAIKEQAFNEWKKQQNVEKRKQKKVEHTEEEHPQHDDLLFQEQSIISFSSKEEQQEDNAKINLAWLQKNNFQNKKENSRSNDGRSNPSSSEINELKSQMKGVKLSSSDSNKNNKYSSSNNSSLLSQNSEDSNPSFDQYQNQKQQNEDCLFTQQDNFVEPSSDAQKQYQQSLHSQFSHQSNRILSELPQANSLVNVYGQINRIIKMETNDYLKKISVDFKSNNKCYSKNSNQIHNQREEQARDGDSLQKKPGYELQASQKIERGNRAGNPQKKKSKQNKLANQKNSSSSQYSSSSSPSSDRENIAIQIRNNKRNKIN